MIRVRQIKINVNNDSKDEIKKEVARILKIKVSDILKLIINKKSLDARKKPLIYYIYEVDVATNLENDILQNNKDINILKSEEKEYIVTKTNKDETVYIVGAGPAGLLAAYRLALAHVKVVVIERGESVEKRVKDVERFWETGELKENSNIQFGEGGAGTFSDGKLNTLIKDKEKRCRFVFKTFIKCGAPEDILFDYKPHIGTDLLRNVVINLREEIKNLGGKFKYNSLLTNIYSNNNQVVGIEVNHNERIETGNVVLAIGHSARETYEMLYKNKINLETKPFAVGLRIMHSQELINKSLIGVECYDKLQNQSYKVTHKTKSGRGVYSFCMCPGGYVVNSSSEQNALVINGMSNHDRESGVANSAIVVTVDEKDFGNNLFDGMNFQKELEKKAYNLANGKIPLQLYIDFKNNLLSKANKRCIPKVKGEYEFTNLRSILPNNINEDIIESIEAFGNKIKGFNNSETLLAGVETRTSSPIRILRNEFLESDLKGLYPAGEGAGYAGGITSASIDGLKVAEEIINKFNNEEKNL